MPELAAADRDGGRLHAPFTVTRALLRYGRTYEPSVKSFEPYDRIQDPYPEAHDALRALIQKSLGERRPAYIFVNNRLEGNAPGTIRGVLDSLEMINSRWNGGSVRTRKWASAPCSTDGTLHVGRSAPLTVPVPFRLIFQ